MPSVLPSPGVRAGVDRHSWDVQSATIELEALPEPGERAPAPAFAPESVREAAAMINAAKRPVLYLGGGVINAPQAIRELAEKANLPTTMTLMALGMLPKAHRCRWGCWGCTARAAPTSFCRRRIY